MSSIDKIIKIMEWHYGSCEWWPHGKFPDKGWEICAGAILTQSTSWKNVEKALDLMKEKRLTSYESILNSTIIDVERAVRPSGFFRQKASRLKTLAGFIAEMGGMDAFQKNVTREQLLSINGIGSETADSILLYALDRKEFVVDAYTRRIFSRIGLLDEKDDYMKIKHMFEITVPEDMYKNVHGWIVELAKTHCRKNPLCVKCPLKNECRYATMSLV